MFNYFSSCQGIDIASTNVSRYEKEDSGGVSLVNCALCTILMDKSTCTHSNFWIYISHRLHLTSI